MSANCSLPDLNLARYPRLVPRRIVPRRTSPTSYPRVSPPGGPRHEAGVTKLVMAGDASRSRAKRSSGLVRPLRRDTPQDQIHPAEAGRNPQSANHREADIKCRHSVPPIISEEKLRSFYQSGNDQSLLHCGVTSLRCEVLMSRPDALRKRRTEPLPIASTALGPDLH